jgi:hypothetical protein
VRHALRSQHAAKRGDDARISEKIREAHGDIFLFNVSLSRLVEAGTGMRVSTA